MKIYRCLCTQDKKSKKIFIDFAVTPERDPRKVTFEPSVENELSHADLFRLRQKQNAGIGKYLPPLFLYDDRGNLSISGAKELSQKDALRLEKFESTIKAFYQRFVYQHPYAKSTLSGRIICKEDLTLTANCPQTAELLSEAQHKEYAEAKKNGTFDASLFKLPPQR